MVSAIESICSFLHFEVEFMLRRLAVVAFLSLWLVGIAFGQAPRNEKVAETPKKTVALHCTSLWDGRSDALRQNVTVIIEGDRIRSVVDGTAKMPAGTESVQVQGTCMPGLIETHTHVLLQGDITSADYDEQILKQSVPFRALLASRAAKLSLKYGFTTIRDLETEGAGYADVDLKKAINGGFVPGPRMQVAGRAMDVTGAYPVLGYAWELQPTLPKGVQEVDGVEGARKAVREQISYGVDWTKVYSDRSYFIPEVDVTIDGKVVGPRPVLNDVPTFTLDELKAIVDETHRQRRKVASHATALQGVHNSLLAGVDSIEHGQYISDDDLALMKQKGTYYVPTLFVGEYVAEGRGGVWPKMVAIHHDTMRRAIKAGVKIAFGTDVGGFDWGITPARQFNSMVQLGMTPKQAIQSSTLVGAELLGVQNDLGTIETGKFADIIAVPGNPLQDVKVLERPTMTMKGGVVLVQDGVLRD